VKLSILLVAVALLMVGIMIALGYLFAQWLIPRLMEVIP
jgi:hypothetical protein